MNFRGSVHFSLLESSFLTYMNTVVPLPWQNKPLIYVNTVHCKFLLCLRVETDLYNCNKLIKLLISMVLGYQLLAWFLSQKVFLARSPFTITVLQHVLGVGRRSSPKKTCVHLEHPRLYACVCVWACGCV